MMTMKFRTLLAFVIGLLHGAVLGHAFQHLAYSRGLLPRTRQTYGTYREAATARSFHDDKKQQSHFLLEEFKIYSGEVVNPYDTLKVSREADRQTIRKAYINLSQKYHPDALRNKEQTVLPGRCNNLEEVRDEWEKIKLSYEILSNARVRRRYDRHEMIADPGAAMGRAAMNAVTKGATNVGKGLFDMGASAVQSILREEEKKEGEKRTRK